jgi:hypothetical protein
MPAELRRFSADEIYISKHEAWSILKFFWPEKSLAESDLTDQDINFAQGLLLEAIDASYKMGYVEIIYDKLFLKIPGSLTDVKKMVKAFVKKAARHWFKYLGGKSLDVGEPLRHAAKSCHALTALGLNQTYFPDSNSLAPLLFWRSPNSHPLAHAKLAL